MSRIERILVAVDGSEPADRALDFAVDIALRNRASLEVVTVLDLGNLYVYGAPGLTNLPVEDWEASLRHDVLDRALERVIDAAIPSEGHVLTGPVARTLLDRIEDTGPSLVVVGRSGRGALNKLLTGSVCNALTRRSPVPTVVVP